ncbi:MAG: hypothetical protein KCHDKBKB_02056 [Elusimicrobia bacterium]|nr:hypothetical protein [Elusimicrobiota bacterium]
MSKRFRTKTRSSTKWPTPVRWLVALALLPLLWAVLHQTVLMVPHLAQEGFRGWGMYGAGIVSYFVFERIFVKPMWLYVFGHELTHVLTGVLSGAKIHSFKAKSTGGEVHLSKSNAFIALSPYVIPLYAVGVIGLYAMTRHWWNPPHLEPLFQFLLGSALAFHTSLTFSAVHKHQPDLKILGLVLSGVLILLGNTLILAILGISLFSKTPTFTHFARSVGRESHETWKVIGTLSWKGAQKAFDYIAAQPWTR